MDFSRLKRSTLKIFDRFLNRNEIIYEIDGFRLNLGRGHMLPQFQLYHFMYDRFNPFLGNIADGVSRGGTSALRPCILDIGANVGDTVASIIKHTNANVICVEPVQAFFDLLQENVRGFGDTYFSRINMLQAFVSDDENEKFVPCVANGTAFKVMSNGETEIPVYTIPGLTQACGFAIEDVALIKVDTDGYDADCIMSMGNMIHATSAVLYWENLVKVENNVLDKYQNMIEYLEIAGYNNYFVFDNFGNYLCRVSGEGLKQINEYLMRMRRGISTRSFHYVDVLACKENQRALCERNIDLYLKKFK